MPAAPKPANEKERQQALEAYGLLGTEAEEVFNTVIRLAAMICDVPISVISLIDRERQWYFARNNMPREETTREDALCAHAILDFDLMEVYDARSDPRFNDSALVTGEPGIRFYAAQPITSPDGFNLGAICLVGQKPKALDDHQRAVLRELAHIVVSLFEAKKTAQNQAKKLGHLATHDALTDIPNRILAKDRIRSALAQARRAGNKVALLFIDLDGFKSINDQFGHATGDAILTETAQRLLLCVRETDTVARWGGDEFIVCLTGIENPTDVDVKTQLVFDQLLQPYSRGEFNQIVNPSVGVAFYPDDADDAEALVNVADKRMYKIKQERYRSGKQSM